MLHIYFSGRSFFSCVAVFLVACTIVCSQNKTIKHYYDTQKKHLKEEYRVNDNDTTVLDGIYKNFYQNGKIKTVGFYTNNQATDYWEYFYQNGSLKMEGLINNFFNEGHWIYYYENGKKSMEGQMEKGKKNGYWKFYFEDGDTKSEGELKDGKNDGEWKYYYDDGAGLKAVATYINGIGYYTEFYPGGAKKMEGKIKQGKSDSTWNYYYPNGKLKATGIETNGLKQGEWHYYHENGNMSSLGLYKEGQTNGFWQYFSEEGKLSSEGHEKDGQKEGQWKMFYNNGKPKGEANFIAGDGAYTEYYDHGKPRVKGYFKKGKYDGHWDFFYEDGSREGDCDYFNGEGWYTGYYPDGKKKMEGFLKDGYKTGVWRLYKADGTIAGYYKTYYEEPENKIVPGKSKSDSLILVKKPKLPVKPKKKLLPKIRLYRPDPSIYKTFILSADPISMILGGLPLSLEYYVQEKWGIEFTLTYFRKPFFSDFSSIALKSMYQSGLSYGMKYKKYFAGNDFIGLPYLSGELRYKIIDYSSNVLDSNMVSNRIAAINLDESSYEAYFIVGDRFMKNNDRRGFTLDIFFGVGAGFKSFSSNYVDSKENDAIFNTVNRNSFYIPFRFGVNFGYAF